ncbi:MAG: polysaccharide ABC transporter ATP-binding protein [Pirellulales bacterium]
MHPAIRVDSLCKAYLLGVRSKTHDTLAGAISAWIRSPAQRWRTLRRLDTSRLPIDTEDIFWALKDISFEIGVGEVVGIVGRNGAGKSTLLKILSRITEPTSGRAVIHGRVASLLEVGTGFHPELTGRENVYMNGTVLGMKKREIDYKFDEIAAFSGVEKFLDTPIKWYSSGMKLRLAFSVAAHLDPEILIVDEVLAVGDQDFQNRCIGKMNDVARSGRTILFVSHNLPAVQGLCTRAIWLQEGKIRADDSSEAAICGYLASVSRSNSELATRTDRFGDGTIRMTAIEFGTSEVTNAGYWISGQDCVIDLSYASANDTLPGTLDVAIGVRSFSDQPLLYLSTRAVQTSFRNAPSSGQIRCTIPTLPLELGRYRLNIDVKHNGIRADHIQSAAIVEVAAGDYFGTGTMPAYGGVLCRHHWDTVARQQQANFATEER